MAAIEPQAAEPQERTSRKTQPARFNYRVVTNFEDYQIENIAVLKKKMGGTDNSIVRTSVDLLAYLYGLPVKTDPTLYLNNFLIRAHQMSPLNGGPTNGR